MTTKMFSVKMAGRLLFVFSVLALAVSLAWVCPGRMTGGGSVFKAGTRVDSAILDNTGRVTHGFELHCQCDGATPPLPNNLEINWKDDGKAHRFHLTELTSADCSYDPTINPYPPPAGFNTMRGIGVGRFDGNDKNAAIQFVLTDAGEPGTSDTAEFHIQDSDANSVLDVDRTPLTFGNQQAHGRD